MWNEYTEDDEEGELETRQKMKSSLSDVIDLIVLECFLLSVCLIGDHILFTCQDSVIKAVSDNITHASVGFISWIIIIYSSSMSIISNVKTNCSWILAAGLLSSLIDLDHFVAAHSLHLDVNNFCYGYRMIIKFVITECHSSDL